MKLTQFDVLDEDIVPEQINTNSLMVKKVLNPLIWNECVIDEEIKDQAIEIGYDFFDFCTKDLGKPPVITDILFTGGLANYMWSKFSDFDIHVVTEYSKINDDIELIGNYFRDKSTLYSLEHKYNIAGFEVEVNMNDIVEYRKNAGVYSLLNNKWVQIPDIENIDPDYDSIKTKTASLMNKIDHTACTLEDLKDIKKKISKMRDAALESEGEFSIDNLVFKLLRRSGYIDKLKNNIEKLTSKPQ
jgi:hypothetical protein